MRVGKVKEPLGQLKNNYRKISLMWHAKIYHMTWNFGNPEVNYIFDLDFLLVDRIICSIMSHCSGVTWKGIFTTTSEEEKNAKQRQGHNHNKKQNHDMSSKKRDLSQLVELPGQHAELSSVQCHCLSIDPAAHVTQGQVEVNKAERSPSIVWAEICSKVGNLLDLSKSSLNNHNFNCNSCFQYSTSGIWSIIVLAASPVGSSLPNAPWKTNSHDFQISLVHIHLCFDWSRCNTIHTDALSKHCYENEE